MDSSYERNSRPVDVSWVNSVCRSPSGHADASQFDVTPPVVPATAAK